uniref:YfhO family protein n=1 Tax=candidate division WOR-3 bacterium TaxID=2052148 RepID=A0A7V0Z413_UNCW3
MAKKQRQKSENENFLEKNWDIVIIILLFILPLIYFAQFLSADKMIAGSDYLLDGYPFEKYSIENGGFVFWYPMVFGGFPALGAPVGGQLAPLAQLKYLFPPQIGHCITFIMLFFIAGIGMYLYLKELNLSKYSAAVGAFVYQWIGNLATTPEAGHTGRAASIALFGLILFFLHRALNTRKFNYFILLSVVITLAFYQGHFQITYYSLIIIVTYVIYLLVTHRKEMTKKDYGKIFGYGVISIVLIFLLMAVIWLPVLGGMKMVARGVERGYEYAASWNLPPVEIFDLFVPNFSGGLENYWSHNPMKLHTEFFGVMIIVFFAFALLFSWKRKYLRFFVFTGLIALLYSFGGSTFVHRFFYELVPGFKLMRAPGLAFYLVSFSMIVIGAIGFEDIMIQKKVDKKKFMITGVILLTSLLIILFLVAPALANSQAGARIAYLKRNLPSYYTGALISTIIVVLTLIFTYLSLNQKIRISTTTLIFLCITLCHQLPVMAKYLPAGPAPEEYYKPDDVIKFLKNDTGIYRVFPFQYGPRGEHDRDSYLLYHNIQSAGGYIANPIQRYQDLIGAGMSVMFNPQNLIQYPKLVDVLNLKYIIAPNLPEDISGYDQHSQRIIVLIKNYLSRFRPVYKGYQHTVYQNDSVLNRACIIADYVVLPEEKILDFMKSPGFNPGEAIILEDSVNIPHPDKKFPMADALIKKYTPNQIVIETNSPYPGFLLLIDNWHPDWQVFVDGKKERLLRANYTFRAVHLSEGRHNVIFEYKSRHFSIGLIITITTVFALLGFYIPLGLWRLAVKYRTKSAVGNIFYRIFTNFQQKIS